MTPSAIIQGLQVTRDDLLLKRQRIECGELTSWTRYASAHHVHNSFPRELILNYGLRALGLYERGARNARQPAINPISFTFDTLPDAFDGFTILHLTDLHADGVPGLADYLVQILGGLEVDLCVITGDFRFDTKGPCQQVYPPMARILSGINAHHGIVGVLGNHDQLEMAAGLEELGMKILLNEAITLSQSGDRLCLAGVDDPHHYGCADISVALGNTPRDAFTLLLAHTPELYAEAAAHDIDLYLCGHTHGGQICLPFLGPIITNATCPRPYSRGSWRHGPVQGYTNVGAGSSGVPVRFFCPPEVGLITLRRSSSQRARSRSSALEHHL